MFFLIGRITIGGYRFFKSIFNKLFVCVSSSYAFCAVNPFQLPQPNKKDFSICGVQLSYLVWLFYKSNQLKYYNFFKYFRKLTTLCNLCRLFMKLIWPFKVPQPGQLHYAIFPSWLLTVKLVDSFYLDCQNCAVELIKLVMHSNQFNHLS